MGSRIDRPPCAALGKERRPAKAELTAAVYPAALRCPGQRTAADMLPWAVLPIGRPQWAAELPGLTAANPFPCPGQSWPLTAAINPAAAAHSLPCAALAQGKERRPARAELTAAAGRRYAAQGSINRRFTAGMGKSVRIPCARKRF